MGDKDLKGIKLMLADMQNESKNNKNELCDKFEDEFQRHKKVNVDQKVKH